MTSAPVRARHRSALFPLVAMLIAVAVAVMVVPVAAATTSCGAIARVPVNVFPGSSFAHDFVSTGTVSAQISDHQERLSSAILKDRVAVLSGLHAGSGVAITNYDQSRRLSSERIEASTIRGPPRAAPAVASQEDAVLAWASGVAAKAADDIPTVLFSRSRGPGIASNFDNAVANGAPTRLTRVGDAARNANRRDALRGQSRAPAGQSLDEYPFACSAQGGCGSFVRSVPVGEQHYQGGVLSQFFQRSGVQPGDPFNVMFGP